MKRCLPPLDDWVGLVDGNGNEHRAGEFAGWGFYWKYGAIHIGRTTEIIARKAAALFVSLWLRGLSASFSDKIMSGMIWFWELQEGPLNPSTPLDLAKLFHETYERLAPSFGYQTRPETRQFKPDSPNGRLMIAVCEEILRHLKTT